MHARTLMPYLSLIIAVCFIGAPLLHSIVPHDDGATGPECSAVYGYGHCPPGSASHGAHESTLWSFIHNSITHEEKKTAIPLDPYIFVILALSFALARPLSRITPFEGYVLDGYRRALARGRFRFRAFG